MFKELSLMWFFVILISLSFACYRAFMAVDFSKVFKSSSTWQIKLLCLTTSIALSSIISFAFIGIIYIIDYTF